jgi:hypothetical protein
MVGQTEEIGCQLTAIEKREVGFVGRFASKCVGITRKWVSMLQDKLVSRQRETASKGPWQTGAGRVQSLEKLFPAYYHGKHNAPSLFPGSSELIPSHPCRVHFSSAEMRRQT